VTDPNPEFEPDVPEDASGHYADLLNELVWNGAVEEESIGRTPTKSFRGGGLPSLIPTEAWRLPNWGPMPRLETIRPLGVTFHWEGPHMGVYRPDQYAGVVRGIEKFHRQTRGWLAIAYNWLVDPHGQVFEGRGAFKRSAANGTNDGNESSEAICYIGGIGDPFTEEAARAIGNLVAWRRHQGVGNKVWTHDNWRPTQCPGLALRQFALGGIGEVMPDPLPQVYRWELRPTMALDTYGLHVSEWKQRLAKVLGRWIGESGEFGDTTRLLTMEFQHAVGLDPDGIAGPKTQLAMQWIIVAKGLS
jgi:peptidoglycan hydrolase-like protein with peptidoglycan-binding domain